VKYGVRMYLPMSHVDRFGWGAFWLLDRALRRGARQFGWSEVGSWVLVRAAYSADVDAWEVVFRVRPSASGEVSTQ
jgi:hypothetical protein